MAIGYEDLPPAGQFCRLLVEIDGRQYEREVKIAEPYEGPRSGPCIKVWRVEHWPGRGWMTGGGDVYRLANIVAVGPLDGPALKAPPVESNGQAPAAKPRASKPAKTRAATPAPELPEGHVVLSIAGRAFRLLESAPKIAERTRKVIAAATFTQRGRWGGGTYTIECDRKIAESIVKWFEKTATTKGREKDRESRNDMRACLEAAAKIKSVLG